MQTIALAGQADFEGWRNSARAMLVRNVKPNDVFWTVGRGDSLFDRSVDEHEQGRTPSPLSVPKSFIELARTALLHSDPERFALLYRLLWRLRGEPRLLEIAVDADVARAEAMAKSVRRDIHKMRAFVRFRRTLVDGIDWYVAWFEPEHHIVEANAPFFMRRFTSMRWSIVTPQMTAHWDGENLSFGDGGRRSDAPADDAMEDLWRGYYASIFNPARLKIDAMRAEMPMKYWQNLPEAELIAPLIKDAARRSDDFIAEGATEANAKPQRLRSVTAPAVAAEPGTLAALRADAAGCKNCPLWQPATQTVFGEGPADAPLMFVGEQPGDQEDIEGRPFVGPAGQVFDRALKQAGLDRSLAYVTNAVKHFKFQPRGKKRIHQKPSGGDIQKCRFWVEYEIGIVRPRLIVMLGASAAQSIFGKATTIRDARGRVVETPFAGSAGLVTVHPSYLLRLPDDAAREEEFARFVEDLRLAQGFLQAA